ncbi:MAG: helix-turn-helix domain-containing protein [Candidatus Lokiarchaeota archaeon]|nr:helix-turn-helix domain-containing protein [Candidatus Lokiarchaeota archaeon]MBD3198775.1 helix-turn-helix domain-containing protein [Candidatus Lokiarchaeota archaeon]
MKTKVKELREIAGMTQEQLGEKLGVSRQTVYYLEKGDYNPTLTLSFKLSEVFGKSIDEIFYQEPIIKDVIEQKSLKELKTIAESIGISYNKISKLTEIKEERLLEEFDEELLRNIADGLDFEFNKLFED